MASGRWVCRSLRARRIGLGQGYGELGARPQRGDRAGLGRVEHREVASRALAVTTRQVEFLPARRRGSEPEVPYKEGSGIAYEPGLDHPLLIPSAGDARPVWTLEDFKRAAMRAQPGQVAVSQFHGVPEGEHPWVQTPRERFEEYMAWRQQEGSQAIALRDLARYVDPDRVPADPLAAMEQRKQRKASR